MDKYRVWIAIDRKPGIRTIGGKWVYARKLDGETGLPSTYKAKWVAKGYAQIEEIDFQEVFASVAHKDSATCPSVVKRKTYDPEGYKVKHIVTDNDCLTMA